MSIVRRRQTLEYLKSNEDDVGTSDINVNCPKQLL